MSGNQQMTNHSLYNGTKRLHCRKESSYAEADFQMDYKNALHQHMHSMPLLSLLVADRSLVWVKILFTKSSIIDGFTSCNWADFRFHFATKEI
jgi:hypothetical protein